MFLDWCTWGHIREIKQFIIFSFFIEWRAQKEEEKGIWDKKWTESIKKYGRGYGKSKFVIWHYKDAFELGKACVDGVCGECKITHDKNGHKCPICNQSIEDYREESLITYMPRNRNNWKGPGPETCAICDIEMWGVNVLKLWGINLCLLSCSEKVQK